MKKMKLKELKNIATNRNCRFPFLMKIPWKWE